MIRAAPANALFPMSKPYCPFPIDFLWVAATAAYQVEVAASEELTPKLSAKSYRDIIRHNAVGGPLPVGA